MSMKKSARVLSIVALILTIAAAVLLLFTPDILKDASYIVKDGNVFQTFVSKVAVPAWKADLELFTGGASGWRWVLPIALGLLVLMFIFHIILMIVKKRSAVFVCIVFLLCGFIVIEMGIIAVYPGVFEKTGSTHLARYLLSEYQAGNLKILGLLLAILPYALAAIAGILLILAWIFSMVYIGTHGRRSKKYTALGDDENSPLLAPANADSDGELKDALAENYGVPNRAQVTPAGYSGSAPTIVQYISYDGKPRGGEKPLTKDEMRDLIKEELDKRNAPVEEDSDLLSEAELRDIIREELGKKDAPVEEEAEEELREEPVLTAKELRQIVREELTGTGPKEEPIDDDTTIITTEDLRKIIRQEIEANKGPEVEPEPVKEEKGDVLTSDDLRQIVREELDRNKPEPEPVPEENPEEKPLTAAELRALIQEALEEHDHPERRELTEDEARDLIVEEIKTYYCGKEEPVEEEKAEEAAPSLSADEVRAIIREEIAAKPEPEPVKTLESEEVKSIVAEEIQKLRDEQKAAADKAAEDAADAARVEQARAEAEAEQVKAQNEEIKAIKESVLSADEIRAIFAEELEKRLADRVLAEEKPAEPEPEPVPEVIIVEKPAEPAPEPEPEPAAEKAKIIRIPFPTRMLDADEETKQNYNELKAEALSYGLKSRLSNSGDTFRLHTKTYLKITIAGKGLKIYYALNPVDYADSSIPVHDAGAKNIYKEIPAVFKVKSPLSLRRAKQLITDACEKDNLEQGKIEEKDWVNPLKDYRPQLGGKNDDDE